MIIHVFLLPASAAATVAFVALCETLVDVVDALSLACALETGAGAWLVAPADAAL